MPATRRPSTPPATASKAILESGLDPKALFATDEQTAATVEECIRYDAPLHMFTRYALRTSTLDNGLSFSRARPSA